MPLVPPGKGVANFTYIGGTTIKITTIDDTGFELDLYSAIWASWKRDNADLEKKVHLAAPILHTRGSDLLC